MDKLKRILINTTLLLLATVFSLLMLELFYRVYLFGNSAFSFEKMNSLHHLGVSGLVKPAEHRRCADLQTACRNLGGRVGQPDEIGQAVLFLADNSRSSFITGEALVVDGGATARFRTE